MKKLSLSIGIIAFSLAVVGLVSTNKAFASPGCTAIATGNWNNPAIWSNCNGAGGIPDPTDSVSISTDSTVTIDTAGTVANSLYFYEPSTGSKGLTIVSPGSLSVTGAVVMRGSFGVGNSTLAVGDGTLSAASIEIDAGSSTGVASVSVSTGTINISGSVTFFPFAPGGNAQLISTGASTINIGGDLGNNGNVTTSGTGTINFNGSGPQVMGAYTTYNNVTVTNTSGGVTLGGTVDINGTLTVNSGTLESGVNNLTVTGATTVANGGTLLFSGNADQTFNGDVNLDAGSIWNETATPAIYFGGNFIDDSTSFTANTGPHVFTGTSKVINTPDDTIPELQVTSYRDSYK